MWMDLEFRGLLLGCLWKRRCETSVLSVECSGDLESSSLKCGWKDQVEIPSDNVDLLVLGAAGVKY